MLSACAEVSEHNTAENLCTADWFQAVEQEVKTGDDSGHGPDLGSPEWRSVVEFRLNIRDDAGVPDRASHQWCEHIDELVFN